MWAVVDAAVPGPRRRVSLYLLALLGSLVSTALAVFFRDVVGTTMPFLFGLGSVIVSATVGGLLPALVTTVLNLASILWLAPTPGVTTSAANVLLIATFSCILGVAGEIGLRARERGRAEAWRCQQREHYLQSIFESLPAPMIVADGDGYILAANRSADGLFQRGAGLLPDHSLSHVLDADARLILSRAGATAGARIGAVTGLLPDGSRRDLSIAVAPFLVAGHRYHTVYLRDETEQRLAQARMAELQAEVQQLSRATALGQLGSAIAHELNQPLTSAALYAGALPRLIERGQEEEAAKAANGAVAQIFRANAVLQRLRSFVRSSQPVMEWLPAREVVEGAVELGRLAVKQAGADLSVDIDNEVHSVFVDRVQIQQVLLNLLVNAAEAVRGRERRWIRLSVSPVADGRALVSLRDTGPGVPAHMRMRLFKPFASGKEEGLGVGLAISKSLVDAHGGEIWCEHGDVGGCFRFTLKHRQREDVSYAA